jgi:hypothetical protein
LTHITRRRLLCVTGAALAAGCSESEEPTRDRTVTPVEVPRSAEDATTEATDVPVPTVPEGVILSDAHRQRVVGYLESLRERAERELTAADGVDREDLPLEGRETNQFESVGHRIENLAEATDHGRFRRVDRRFRSLGVVVGYVRAETGGLDVDGLRKALESEQSATRELADGLEYRIAPPVMRHLPTVEAAEETLGHAEARLRAAERAVEAAAEADDDGRSETVGSAWGRIEQVRIARTNAAGILETATDPDAPSRRAEIDDQYRAVREATEYPDPPESDGSADDRNTERIRTILSSVLSRLSDVLDRPAEDLADTERVTHLLDAVRVRNEAEALVDAAELTYERLDGDSFPPEAVPEEKRRGVDSVESLAEAAPLQRELGRLAEDMLSYGDRRLAGASDGSKALGEAHFVYVGAQRFVDRSLADGRMLAAALGDAESASLEDN